MQESIRAFIAIDIPDELKKALTPLKKEIHQEGVKLVEDANVHITLKFLGNVQRAQLSMIESALRSIKFKKFHVSLRGVGVYPNERYVRVVWVGCESKELAALAADVNNALVDLFPREQFSPHLTIARVKKKIDIVSFLSKHRNDTIGEFEVSSFELKSSQLTRNGPIYSTIAVFQQEGQDGG